MEIGHFYRFYLISTFSCLAAQAMGLMVGAAAKDTL